MFIRYIIFTIMMSTSLMVAGCGSNDSSSGSLSLSVDKSSATGGDVIVASVKLTSSISNSAVNKISVRVMSSDQSAIADVSGKTNLDGTATILLNVGWVTTDKTVYLVAGSDVSSQSTSVKITVLAPKLTINIPAEIAPPSWQINASFVGTMVASGYSLNFSDGNGHPFRGQVIDLYIDSITNKGFEDWIVYNNGVKAPPEVFSSSTDDAGNVFVPMTIEMRLGLPGPCSTDATTGVFKCTGTSLSIMTVHWRAVADFAGQLYTTLGDSLVTFTNTGV